jgi:hypothetical protein
VDNTIERRGTRPHKGKKRIKELLSSVRKNPCIISVIKLKVHQKCIIILLPLIRQLLEVKVLPSK